MGLLLDWRVLIWIDNGYCLCKIWGIFCFLDKLEYVDMYFLDLLMLFSFLYLEFVLLILEILFWNVDFGEIYLMVLNWELDGNFCFVLE